MTATDLITPIPASERIIEMRGDSMYDPANPYEPGSIHPGDLVIIDVDNRDTSQPGTFAIWDREVCIRIVERIVNSEPPRLLIRSRNPAYSANEHLADDVKIVGRARGRVSPM